jgi:CRP/FNR family cyclic AMP-dependent transcriptional regulator
MATPESAEVKTMIDEDFLIRKTLKLVHLFAGFSEQDARDFLTWARRVQARPSESIIREGEQGQDMYIVASGKLKVLKSDGAEGEELAVLGPGDSFGEIALLDSGARSASVVAVDASTLLRFERRNLVKIPAVSLKLYRNIATMVATRLRDTSTRVILARTVAAASTEQARVEPTPQRPRRQFLRAG